MTSVRFRSQSCIFAVICASALWPPGSNAADATKIVKYAASSMQVTERATGSCWTSSIASTRLDAYRCMVRNEIHDPCFTLSSREVVCPHDLVKNSGLLIKLTKPLPPAASPQPAKPWAMVLAGNKTCNRATGTADPDYPFYCEGSSGACSTPILSSAGATYEIRCATVVGGKAKSVMRFLVSVVYM
jgi:hypothetical protein